MFPARTAMLAALALSAAPALAETGDLRRGEAAMHDFEIAAGDSRVLVVFEWADRATEWDLVLRSANGVQVTGSTTGLSIEKGPFSYRITIDRRAAETLGWAGTWTVRLRLLDTHRRRPVVTYTFRIGGSRAGARVKLDVKGLGGVHRAGDRVTLEVQAVSKAAVTGLSAVVIPMDDDPVAEGEGLEVILRDDGVAPDDDAGDGVWTGSFAWRRPGKFRVVATATAVDDEGRPSEHEEGREVRVREARRDLRGS